MLMCLYMGVVYGCVHVNVYVFVGIAHTHRHIYVCVHVFACACSVCLMWCMYVCMCGGSVFVWYV